jgi:methylthioribose-1-phosphate isomerase
MKVDDSSNPFESDGDFNRGDSAMGIVFETVTWAPGQEGRELPGSLKILDQTRLPGEAEFLYLGTPEEVWDAIRRLAVRGAPAIGIAAAYGLILGLQHAPREAPADFLHLLDQLAHYLSTARPTAVNLDWALRRMSAAAHELDPGLTVDGLLQHLLQEAHQIREEDLAMSHAIGRHGAELLRPGMGVLTHCNAGGLATSGYGTALAPVYVAREHEISVRVYVDETRPLLQGARLTAWELQQRGIEVTVLCDSAASFLMRKGLVDVVIVGADRVAANGDVANKIGTYMLSLAARSHRIPFYVAMPSSTIDLDTPTGREIVIEERPPEEITEPFGYLTAPRGVKVFNPAFDITPHQLVSGFITEHGILYPPFAPGLQELIHHHKAPGPTGPANATPTST